MSLTITIASLFNAPRIVPFGALRTFSGVPVGSATAQATTAAFAVVAITVAAARDKAAIIRLSMVVFSIRRLISAVADFVTRQVLRHNVSCVPLLSRFAAPAG